MLTCTDTLMGSNSHFGGKVQKVKKNISLYLYVTENIKAHSTTPRAQKVLKKCWVGFLLILKWFKI